MRIRSELFRPRRVVISTVVMAVVAGLIDLAGQGLVGSGMGSWLLHAVCGLGLLWWVSMGFRMWRKSAATWVDVSPGGISWSAPEDVVQRAGLAAPGSLEADEVAGLAVVDGLIRLRVLVGTKLVRVLQLQVTAADGRTYILPNASSHRQTNPTMRRLIDAIQATPGLPPIDVSRLPQGARRDGRAIRRGSIFGMVQGLPWWQAVFVLVPWALVPTAGSLFGGKFGGGFIGAILAGGIGGLLGGAAAGANTALARRARYGAGITALAMSTVSIFAYGVYFLIVGAVQSEITSSQQPSAPLGAPTATAAAPTPYRTPHTIQPFRPVPAGVIANQPSVISATGAAVTWPAYLNTSGDAHYDVATYEVYRSTLNHDLSHSPGTLIGSVRGDKTSFVDTSAPARTGPHDGIYNYLIGVRTKAGRFIQGTPVLVQLPVPGETELAIPATAADTIASGQPNAIANTVLSLGTSKVLEIGPDEDLGLGNTRLVFDFGPLAALPAGAALVEAHLSVWRTSGGNYPDQYTLYALNRSFTGSQVTWNNASTGTAWAHPGGDYTAPTGRVLQAIDPTIQRSDFDATVAVRGWISRPNSEHGLLLKADTESVKTAPFLNGFYVPIGGSYPPWECPQLYITYTGAAATGSATP